MCGAYLWGLCYSCNRKRDVADCINAYYDYYKEGETRLDLLSYQYYEDPNYDWLIMQANPEYGYLEYQIPNGSKLRIPFPLESTLTQYNKDIETYNILYGIE